MFRPTQTNTSTLIFFLLLFLVCFYRRGGKERRRWWWRRLPFVPQKVGLSERVPYEKTTAHHQFISSSLLLPLFPLHRLVWVCSLSSIIIITRDRSSLPPPALHLIWKGQKQQQHTQDRSCRRCCQHGFVMVETLSPIFAPLQLTASLLPPLPRILVLLSSLFFFSVLAIFSYK